MSASQSSEQSLSTAIASSMPPSIAVLRWKTCITTRGCRPSREQRGARVVEVRVGVVALAHLLDRQVEDLRVETGSVRCSGRHSRAPDRRRGRPPRPRAARARDRPSRAGCCSSWPGRASARASGCRGLPRHPAEDLDRRADRADRAGEAGRAAHARRAPARRGCSPAAGCGEQRADEVRAAALVLLRARLVVLVAPDRDVLGAVIGGELAAAQRQQPQARARARPASSSRAAALRVGARRTT